MKRDARIDDYIERAAPFAQPILNHVRERVHAAVPDVEEGLKWGAPGFSVGGKLIVMMAAFKGHAVVNFWRGQELRGDAAIPNGMGQFGKLTCTDDLPADADFKRLIHQATKLAKTEPAPRQVKHVPAEMHPDFAKALESSPAAKVCFDGFTPGCRREYADWIAEAKRDDTRTRRITTAIEWLSEGKKRHWKYEKC